VVLGYEIGCIVLEIGRDGMAIQVYLVKRFLKDLQRNGRRKYRWVMRWEDPATGKYKCKSTGTADKTKATALRDLKWDELNRPQQLAIDPLIAAVPASVEEKRPGPTWDDCKKAIRRAMEADKLRPASVSDALMMLASVRRTFPDAASPADITADMANEYKRRRSEDARGLSAWTIKGDIACLKAIFGKWLGKECGLLNPDANPFKNVRAPRCDEPEVRIITAKERADFYGWLGTRWNNWQLPMIYLDVADATGWRATEIASMTVDDVLEDGFIRVLAESSKTRRHKHNCLAPILHAELRACAADGWTFGRFSDELRRLLMLWKRQPHHAAKVKDFSPDRLVGWIQDEIKRYNDEQTMAAANADPPTTWQTFTLHDFRRTAITALQMSGVSEKETSVLVGATPEVIRKHYEKMDQHGIARRALERRLAIEGPAPIREQSPQSLRARCARAENDSFDNSADQRKTNTA
jgi:integrase